MQQAQLSRLVTHYQAHVQLDPHLAFYRDLLSLDEAISQAALAKLPNGKRHNHQRRLSRSTLDAVKQNLLANKSQLETCRSFHDIISLVRACAVPGFGELACYDTALRIAVHLNKWPAHVYLHCGTRIGASKLGLKVNREHIPMDELPEALRALQPHQIEYFLCIYKDHLNGLELDEDSRIGSCTPNVEEDSCVGSCTPKAEHAPTITPPTHC